MEVEKLPYPPWIETPKFHPLLREIFTNFKEIVNFSVKPAIDPGENYSTVILRITVEVELENATTKLISFIMKVPPENEIFHKVMKVYNVFEVETAVYQDIVTEFEEMYRNTGLEIKFTAKLYNSEVEQPHLLLEDLSVRGFKNMPRHEGLDMEYMKAALKKLAQWHAASAHRVATKGPYPSAICESFLSESLRDIMRNLSDSFHKEFLECAKSYKDVKAYYHDLKQNDYDELLRSVEEEKYDFCVLNHGDCWSNNIMFQHDATGNINETYLIDFQGPRYGSPAQDLYTFILSSAKYELKLEKFDYFIRYYHDCLVENLKILNYPKATPTLKDLHIMLCKYGIWGYKAAVGSMATVLQDSCKEANVDEFNLTDDGGKRFKNKLFTNPKYLKHIESYANDCTIISSGVNIVNFTLNISTIRLLRSSSLNFHQMSNQDQSDPSPVQAGAPTPPPLPSWIEPSAFESVFREVCPDLKQVKDFKAIPALGAGENYATLMLRLTAEVELK
ncbi:uncharacterized protein LOC133335443, partial [Musca vetustissima]|uniref:uncharacterized protein LOC133335443 n=1 Tax=Musca vetustissima TaxID=27455 RepID=UPI002AB6194E